MAWPNEGNKDSSKSDKKLYRHITLSNGLKCVLICDTVAMRQRKSLSGDHRSRENDNNDESEDYGRARTTTAIARRRKATTTISMMMMRRRTPTACARRPRPYS